MKFNSYIWSLYQESEAGRKKIGECKPFKEIPDDESFLLTFESEDVETILQNGFGDCICEGKVNILKIYHRYFSNKPFQIDKADEIFSQWINDGVHLAGLDILLKDADERWWEDIEYISNALYVTFPDFFFPYFFLHSFDNFRQICDAYYIVLPDVPKKSHKRERTMYYTEICKALYEFRVSNDLSPEELVAFIYDFAPNSLEADSEAGALIASPSKVWYVGGGKNDFVFLDNAQTEDVERWQSNTDVRVGDVLIMYCSSPRSYIHSVWRAVNDGFTDPFFYYHSITYISTPVKVPHISFQELKTNPILSKSSLVRKNFQGVNGYPVTNEEYSELLRVWDEKGMDVSILPLFEIIKHLSDDVVLKDERDVEIYLLEPLLLRLKYKPTDWVRQMPVRMGRGERFYPDYCFGAVFTRGEESARMLIEAKYSIKNSKYLKEAYLQAKSYAMRLQADTFALVSKEGLWIYKKSGKIYDAEKHTYFTWNDIENPDNFHVLSKMISNR